MPELPDVTVYLEAIHDRVVGQALDQIRILSPFLLRTFEPPVEAVVGRKAVELHRLGKRIAIGFEGDLWLVVHLMIAGRFHWKDKGAKPPGKIGLAVFDFSNGSLTLTEAGSKRRASLHVIAGKQNMLKLDPGGIDVLKMSLAAFTRSLKEENHTVKRTLTDPHRFSGIGNAYSDEILHHAKLSPIKQTQKLTDEEIARLFASVKETLKWWIDHLRTEAGSQFPENVTAFHPEMSVHGRFGLPCPACQAPVQRIRYADNETNYCAKCQTDGRVLADRSLSRLLKDDWPRSIDEWE